jgi:hypothetical protein
MHPHHKEAHAMNVEVQGTLSQLPDCQISVEC